MPRRRKRESGPADGGPVSILDDEEVDLPGGEETTADEPAEDPFANRWSEELEERARDYMWLWFQDWYEERQPLYSSWQRQWELYLNKSKLHRYVRVHGHQVFVPRSFILTETIAPRTAKAIFGADKWFGCQSLDGKDQVGAELAEASLYWNADRNRWKARGTDWVRMACIHGFGVVKAEWVRRKVSVPKRIGIEEPIKDAAGREIGKRTRLDGDGLQMEDLTEEYVRWRLLPPHAYFQGLKDSNPQECSGGAGDVFVTDFQTLKEKEADDYYHDVDRLLVGLEPGGGGSGGSSAPALTGLKKGQHSNSYFGWDQAWWMWAYDQARDIASGVGSMRWVRRDTGGNPDFTIRAVQRLFPLNGVDKPWVWCEIHMCGPFMLRCAPNTNPLGTTDYHLLLFNPIPGVSNGQGVIEPNISLMIEEGEHRNLILDASSLRVRPMATRVHGGMMPGAEIVWKSGGIIDTKFPNALAWLAAPPSMQESMAQAAILEQLQFDCAGTPPVLMGGSEGGRQTAGEVSTKQFEANIRHQWQGEIIEVDSVRGLMEHSLALTQTHMTVKRVVRLLGPKGWGFKEMTPEEIMGRYEVRLKTSTEVANDALAVNQANNFLTTAANLGRNPEVMRGIDWIQVLKSIAEMMRTPGRERWFKDRKTADLTFWQQVKTYQYGGELEVSVDEDNLGFMAYVNMPGPVDEITGQPAPSIFQEFLESDAIDPEYKDRFTGYVMDRANLAQQQMLAMMGGMPGMPGMPGAPGGPGAPMQGGQMQGEPPVEGAPPQEMPRSMEAIARMGGQAPVATPAARGARFKGNQ